MNRGLSRFLCMALVILALPLCSNASRLVELDASRLQPGSLTAWTNAGSLQGSFNAVRIGGATVQTVDGRKAVTFDGSKDFLCSSFPAPAGITGNNAFTVAVWVYNPTVDGIEEPLVYWAHRGTDKRAAHLNYGNSKASGAMVHWGGDLGYETVPSERRWHQIVVTYAGGKDGEECLYVDGKLSASARRTLDLFSGDPIYLGTTEFEKFFSGSLAEVKMFDYALSTQEIDALANSGQNPRPALVELSANNLPEGRLEKWPNTGKLGGSFGLASSTASVNTVGERKAVQIGGKSWLESDFGVDLAKGPFTVEYWAYRQDVNDIACPVLSLGDQQAPELARFGYSSASSNGALFYGTSAAGFSHPAPKAKNWHQIAVTRTADGEVKLYVDGELDKQAKADSLAAQTAKLQLGAAWVAKRGTPVLAPQVSVARLCVYDEALSQRQIRNDNGQFTTFAPTPANKAQTTGFETTLKWSEGDESIRSVNVYLGTDKQAVETANETSKAFKGSVNAGKMSFGPLPIDLEQTYYWRVDEIGADGKVAHQGTIWSFSSESGKATALQPRAQTSAVAPGTKTLTWTPGKYASKQTVYFSTNRADVESGKAAIAKNLKAAAGACKMPKLDYGRTYYWRVASENGTHPASTGDVWSFRTTDKLVANDITFYVGSDLHYGASPTTAASNELTIDFMNTLPGTAYPAKVGGNVATPRGVVLTGDLTNAGDPDQWALFVKDWGVNGEGRICYPVYEGFGNHDGSIAPGKVVAKGIAERTKTRVGVKSVSKNGVHYSWDWDQLHMVELNLYAGDLRVKEGKMDGPGHEPLYSLEFLKQDLAQNVGNSGRPVIIAMHLGFDEGFSLGWGWWSVKETDAFYEAIKDYNVIGILYGHTHAAANYKWRGIDVYNCASTQRDPNVGECMVFHVTPKELTVLQRFSDHWSEDIWRKPITGMTPNR